VTGGCQLCDQTAGAIARPKGYVLAMKALRLILAPVFLAVFAVSASAQMLSLTEMSAYLNSLTIVQSDFRQINDDGSVLTGKILIRRPGRIRFEYDPPDASLVLASRGQVAIFDAKSNQPPQRFALVRTPLNLILGRDIDLEAARMVVGHFSDGDMTTVIAQDPNFPEYGHIQMVFSANPVALRQWIVTDALGQDTTLILNDLDEVRFIAGAKFDIAQEMKDRGF
jgi:outer membrane lipoprotein-sorting protein